MELQSVESICCTNSGTFGGNKRQVNDGGDMPPEARRELVLEFVVQHDIPLPPLAIWAGLNRQHRVTFSYRTMQNILSDLVNEGDLFKVDTEKLRGGEISKIEGDSSSRRAYYFATEEGMDRVKSEIDDN